MGTRRRRACRSGGVGRATRDHPVLQMRSEGQAESRDKGDTNGEGEHALIVGLRSRSGHHPAE